jgi:outer membrane lipoprotein-sorting protein
MALLTTRRAALALFAAPLALASQARAQDDDAALVKRAIAYLDAQVSIKGRFHQTDDRGGVADGTFYLARPGRARFEYDPPSGLLITCDGSTVILSDSRRHTFQHQALAASPLGVFLSDHIRVDRGAQVTRVDRTDGGFSVTARGAQSSQGQITLYFAERPLRLTGWAVLDAQSHTQRVALGPLMAVNIPPADYFTQVQP